MDNYSSTDTFKGKILTILLLTWIFLLNFMSRVILGPLMITIEQDLSISHSQAGGLFLMISIGYFVTLAASGFVAAKLGHRRTIFLSAMSVGAAGMLISISDSLFQVRMSLIALGMGAGLYLPSAVTTITSLVKPQNWGKALAIHELAPNLGLLLSPIMAETFLTSYSWHTLLLWMGLFSIAAGAAFIFFGRGGNFTGDPVRFSGLVSIVRKRSFWIMIYLFSMGVGGSMAVYNMSPLYLVAECGMDRGFTNMILSLSRISGLVLAFAAGWFTDRVGEKTALFYIMMLSGLSTLLLAFTSNMTLLVLVFIQAGLTACFFPPGLSALSRIGTPDARNIIVACTIPFGYLVGGGGLPAMIGYMGDSMSFAVGFAVTGVLILVCPFMIRLLQFHQENDEV